jgi:hypothetical protein
MDETSGSEHYEAPEVRELGTVEELTGLDAGSVLDGQPDS